MIKFDVLNRWTMKVQFTAEIDVSETESVAVKRGAAVKWAYLEGADLKGANLEGAYLDGANLDGADLEGADLDGANLAGANLAGANLDGANLDGADLKWADLEVPSIPNIHQTVYAAATQCDTALDMSTWHTCETTHCRAGWVVTLAGEKGKALEDIVRTPVAAYMIYRKSDPTIREMPDFYCDNESALDDMKRRAELEAAGGVK